jgi:hypothetical protein
MRLRLSVADRAGAFGATAPLTFGAGGGAAPAGSGSRAVAYQKTQELDQSSSSGGAKTTVYFNSITAMPQYAGKSVEELRWEDYQVGVAAAMPSSCAIFSDTYFWAWQPGARGGCAAWNVGEGKRAMPDQAPRAWCRPE